MPLPNLTTFSYCCFRGILFSMKPTINLEVYCFMPLPNLTTFSYRCFRGILFSMKPTIYFQILLLGCGQFQVLVNTYFLNFRLALLWMCLLIEGSCSSNIVIFNNLLVFNFPFFNFEQ